MILVTVATGKVGQELVGRLAVAKAPFRALARSAGKAEAIREAGGEAVVGDFADETALARALDGAERLFLLTNFLPDQPEIEARIVDAAKATDVRRVLRLSSSGADAVNPPLLLRLHWDAERHLEASGLDCTFLRRPAGEGHRAEVDALDATASFCRTSRARRPSSSRSQAWIRNSPKVLPAAGRRRIPGDRGAHPRPA